MAWLSRIWRSKLKPEHTYALRLRVLGRWSSLNATVVRLTPTNPDGTPIENHPYRADDDVYSAADRLIMDLDKVPELFKPTASAFAEEMHASAAAVYLSLGGMDADCLTAARGWLQEEYLLARQATTTTPVSWRGLTYRASRMHLLNGMSRATKIHSRRRRKAAVLELKLASVDPECRAWMAEDPGSHSFGSRPSTRRHSVQAAERPSRPGAIRRVRREAPCGWLAHRAGPSRTRPRGVWLGTSA